MEGDTNFPILIGIVSLWSIIALSFPQTLKIIAIREMLTSVHDMKKEFI